MDKKIMLRLFLLFIPAAYVSYLFHELGHWVIGGVLGNDMAYSLNYVWPKNGYYIDARHDLYVTIEVPGGKRQVTECCQNLR